MNEILGVGYGQGYQSTYLATNNSKAPFFLPTVYTYPYTIFDILFTTPPPPSLLATYVFYGCPLYITRYKVSSKQTGQGDVNTYRGFLEFVHTFMATLRGPDFALLSSK